MTAGLPRVRYDVRAPNPATGSYRRVFLGATKAADQLQAQGYHRAGLMPLPAGQPGSVTGAEVGIADPAGPLTFAVIGDHGGVKDPNPQLAVAQALAQESHLDFIYSVGDVDYFNGDPPEYAPQFYEPYSHLPAPILAIPGNHDGDSTDDVTGSGIASFMANFCTSSPQIPPGDPQFEYGRRTQTQPYCDWALELNAVTIIGAWSNVPSGGHFEQSQIDWLTQTLKAAPLDRPVIVAAHHPVYSVDAHHGGCQKMGEWFDSIFQAASRAPDVVLAGHVHDFQCFTRADVGGSTRYLVVGNSGYHNLHAISQDATDGMDLGNGLTLDYADAAEYGYLKLTVDGVKISGEYVGVTPGAASNLAPQITRNKYTF